MADNTINSNIVFTYDSKARRSPAIEELLDTIRYRDLIYQLVRRDIVARYKRSVLGVFWTMLQPLGMMIVMNIVFSKLFGRIEGYIAYLLSGLIAWTFFSQTTSSAVHQIIWGGALLKRIYVPKTSFSLSSVGTGFVNLILSLIPLLLIVLIARRPVTWAVTFLPIPILCLTFFALGLSLILSTLAIQFPDIKEMYQIIIQAWMYLTPIVYPADILPETYRNLMLYSNPMYYLIEMFRSPIYNGSLPSITIIIGGTTISIITLLIGWVYFSYQSDKFAYLA
ncbi:MAG TPA: ABC transporter [Anaerolineae bacterium]|nr:ABC transporter [Anaerolineae bacterium]